MQCRLAEGARLPRARDCMQCQGLECSGNHSVRMLVKRGVKESGVVLGVKHLHYVLAVLGMTPLRTQMHSEDTSFSVFL